MKRILSAALLAVVCAAAWADVTLGPITSATWTLYRSGSYALDEAGNRIGGFTSEADCFAKVPDNTEQWKKGAVYYCKSSASITSKWAAPTPTPTKPDNVTKTVACVAPLVGSWTQTAPWTLVSGKWVQSAFVPTAAPAGACTAPTPPPAKKALAATRTTCTSPCAVLFDATALQAAFADVVTFDFGDPKPDIWAVSGKSKNSEVGGPIAAHVYLTPGTFTAKAAGGAATIVVADPDVVYAGAKTICVGTSFSGCPAGAAQQAALPATPWSGKRVLLQAGQTFKGVDLQDGNSGVQVGSYGAGAKPVISGTVNVGTWRPTTANFANDVTVMDLDIRGGFGQSIGSRVLALRNAVKISGGGIQMTLGGEDYWANGDQWGDAKIKAAIQNAREIFYVENIGINADTSSAQYGIYGSGSRVALLGNRFGSQQYHSARLTACDRCVIAHNEFQGIDASGTYHALKLHSNGLMQYADATINRTDGVTGWVSSKVVVSNNLLGNAESSQAWTAAVSPQNDQFAEGLEDVIVENNRFVHSNGTSQDLVFGGRRLVSRGNATVDGSKLQTGTGHTAALPSAWQGPYTWGQ